MLHQSQNYYVTLESKAGWIGLLGSDKGLERTTLPQQSEEEAILRLCKIPDHSDFSPQFFRELIEQLVAYFNGDKIDFEVQLDLSQSTEFEKSVWETTRGIPYGETRSYAWVAREIGKPSAPRGVGQALGRNPLPIIIPCHRVIASDGSLRGFGGGLKMKQYLLDIEAKKQ